MGLSRLGSLGARFLTWSTFGCNDGSLFGTQPTCKRWPNVPRCLEVFIVYSPGSPTLVAASFRLFVRIGNNPQAPPRARAKEFQKWSLVLDRKLNGAMPAPDSSKSFVATTYRVRSPHKLAPEPARTRSAFRQSSFANCPTFPHAPGHSPPGLLLPRQVL